jgi:putative ABC transport system permease protein
MAITANDGHSISVLKDKIIATMKEKHKIHPEDDRAIGYFDLYEQYNRVESLFGAMGFIAYFVGVLVLLSGIIGVSNIMLIVVKERTKEIGIRRALGEKPWSIKKQILMESIFLTIFSGMAGIVMGALFIYGVNAILDANGPVDMFLNPSVSLGVVTVALLILIFSGLLAGFIPAQSAIKVKPIEALRTE